MVPSALLVTCAPVNPNIARRIISPSVSASLLPLPSTSNAPSARNGATWSHVVRVGTGLAAIAPAITALPLSPNSARRIIKPSVNASRLPLPSMSSVQAGAAAMVSVKFCTAFGAVPFAAVN